jgi:hypothetical protein
MNNILKHILGGAVLSLLSLVMNNTWAFMFALGVFIGWELCQWMSVYWEYQRTIKKALDSMFDILCGLTGYVLAFILYGYLGVV